MTEPEKRMRAVLEKTGLYFGEDKWLSAELAAYAKGLELVYDTLSHVRRDAFVQTAEEDGLKAFESHGAIRGQHEKPARDAADPRRGDPRRPHSGSDAKAAFGGRHQREVRPAKGRRAEHKCALYHGHFRSGGGKRSARVFACAPQFGVRFRQNHVGRTGRGGELVECARPSKQDLERARRFMSGKEKHGSK